MVGGVCLHTGTIPSKTLREAILYLSGFRERTFYGRDYAVSKDITVRRPRLPRPEGARPRDRGRPRAAQPQPRRDAFSGSARFVDPHTLEIDVDRRDGDASRADHVLIACGTRPAHSDTVPLDGKRIIDSDQLLTCRERCPRDVIVVGAGVIGLEYASMLTALNIKVTVIEARPTILDFVDREMIDSLAVLHAPARRDVPPRREGRLGRLRREEPRRREARERQGDPRRHAALHRRPARPTPIC